VTSTNQRVAASHQTVRAQKQAVTQGVMHE